MPEPLRQKSQVHSPSPVRKWGWRRMLYAAYGASLATIFVKSSVHIGVLPTVLCFAGAAVACLPAWIGTVVDWFSPPAGKPPAPVRADWGGGIRALRDRHTGQLSRTMRQALTNLGRSAESLQGSALEPRDQRDVRDIVEDNLPRLVSRHAEIRADKRLGAMARNEMLDSIQAQVDLMSGQLERMADRAVEARQAELRVNGRYLAEKFGPGI